MPVTNRGRHQGRARGQPRKPNNNQRQVYRQYADRDSSFVWLIVGYFVLLVLDLILKFRLEYIFPLILLFQQVVDECKLSSLSSFFFIAVTLCTDYTIHMLTQSLGKELFMIAGFLVWWQLVCSGENRVTASTITLALIICSFECFVTYKNIRNDSWMYQSPAVRPLALHCIGFPLVSIGYCVKRYIAYLMRIRKQSEVEANNKFYYQLLYEALPPENYMGHIYSQTYHPALSDSSSEDTSVVGENTEPTTQASWVLKLWSLLSDVACFTTTRTPLVQVKSPPPPSSQSTSALPATPTKSNGVSFWSSLQSQWSSISVYFRTARSAANNRSQLNSSSSNSNTPPHQPSQPQSVPSSGTPSRNTINSDKVPITSNNSHHERKHSSRSSRSVTTSQLKSGNSPARQPESSEQVDNNVQSTQQQRRNRKKVDDNSFHSQLLQIKPQIVDMPRDSEVEKLKSRIGQLENEKNDLVKQLHAKNVDLTRHENFTTSELDSLKKKEETLKTELNRERQRRQELELLLRKEEESRKVGERQLQEERRRAQNTTELDQMRIRLRHQESIDEKNRTEMNSLREVKSALGGKLNQMEMQLKSSTQAESQHLKEITKLRNQLKEENKVKINLIQQLTKNQHGCQTCQTQSRLAQQQQQQQQRNYSPQNMFDIATAPSQDGQGTTQGSPNGSFSSSVQQNGFNSSFHQDIDSFDNHAQF